LLAAAAASKTPDSSCQMADMESDVWKLGGSRAI
jgi:hypothetical protein